MAPGPPDDSDLLYESPGADERRPVRPWLVIVALLCLLALVVASVGAFWPRSTGEPGSDAPNPQPGVDLVGMPLPNQTFQTFDGAERSLSELQGPLVINFFAYWCAPCREEMPAFEQAHQLYGDQVTFLGLDYVDNVGNGLKIIEETGITYQVGRDPDGTVLAGLGGVAMPTTVFVDASGTVTSVHSGLLDGAALGRIISDELGVRSEVPL